MEPNQRDLSGIERTGLFSLECRTFFYRHVLNSPDVRSESLIRDLGGDWAHLGGPLGLYNSLHLGGRYALIEEWLVREIQRQPSLQIVNLGCGLESCFHRLGEGNWTALNVDYRDVIALRRQNRMDPPNVENFADSIVDGKWRERIDDDRPVLFILSGVAPYLAGHELDRLLKFIGREFPSGSLIIDGPSFFGRLCTNLSIRLTGWTELPFRSALPGMRRMRRYFSNCRAIEEKNLSRIPVPVSLSRTRLLAFFGACIRLGVLRHVRWGTA